MGTSGVVNVVSGALMSVARSSCTDSRHTSGVGCWQVNVISYP
jgi:hypothetical protein